MLRDYDVGGGDGDYVDINLGLINQNSVTFSVWYKVNSLSDAQWIVSDDDGNYGHVMGICTNGKKNVYARGDVEGCAGE